MSRQAGTALVDYIGLPKLILFLLILVKKTGLVRGLNGVSVDNA
jgi:hypothetical protein